MELLQLALISPGSRVSSAGAGQPHRSNRSSHEETPKGISLIL